MWRDNFLWPYRKCLCTCHPLTAFLNVPGSLCMLPFHGNSCPATPPSRPPKTTCSCVAPSYMVPAPMISISIFSTSVNGISSIVLANQLAPSFRIDTPTRRSTQLTPPSQPPTTPPRTTKPRPPLVINRYRQRYQKTTTTLSLSSVLASCSWPSSASAKSRFT